MKGTAIAKVQAHYFIVEMLQPLERFLSRKVASKKFTHLLYSADKKPKESAMILAHNGAAGLTLASALWKTAQTSWNQHSSSVCQKKLTSNLLTKAVWWVCHLPVKIIINCSSCLCFALRVGELLCQSCPAHPVKHLPPMKPWETYYKYECAL